MKNIMILISFSFLVGCAHNEPVSNIVIQKVEVPIEVPCKAAIPNEPLFNFPQLTIDQDIYEKSKALLADRKLHLAYEIELLATLTACVK
jgi:hypothetical protein